jgi:metal-responsive CopG/Arc/MetJ family transcriptional regulator
MKTAISIQDELLEQVDATARTLGLSRSRLIALAVDEFVQKHRQNEMLRRLNEVYGSANPADRTLLKGVKAKFGRTVKERW